MNEWEGEFGSEAPEGMRTLMRAALDRQMAGRMSANSRAAAAWYRANGDRERAHTVGVFLKKSPVAGAAPVLGVYVDSHAMATDFGVNKDLYLARLANLGFSVSGIDFIVSRNSHRAVRDATAGQAAPPEALPELSDQERLEVERLVSELPESLRPRAAEAIALSKRRAKRGEDGSARG